MGSTKNSKKVEGPTKGSPLKPKIKKGISTKASKKASSKVFVEYLEPGILAAYTTRANDPGFSGFVQPLATKLKNEEAYSEETNINLVSYRKKDDSHTESLQDKSGYPWKCFLRFVEPDCNFKQEAEMFGNDLATVLNSFKYKYENKFVFAGDLTPVEPRPAISGLKRDARVAFAESCYDEAIEDGSFFEDEVLMSLLFSDVNVSEAKALFL